MNYLKENSCKIVEKLLSFLFILIGVPSNGSLPIIIATTICRIVIFFITFILLSCVIYPNIAVVLALLAARMPGYRLALIISTIITFLILFVVSINKFLLGIDINDFLFIMAMRGAIICDKYQDLPFGMLPEILLFLSALIFQLIGVFNNNSLTFLIGRIAIFLSMFLIYILVLNSDIFFSTYFEGGFVIDQQSIYLKIIILVFYIAIILLYIGYIKTNEQKGHSEYIVLMQVAILGGFILVSARNFMVMFLSIEIQGLVGYILATFDRKNIKSSEAGLKYFILGSLFSAITLFGISLIYGSTQSIRYDAVVNILQNKGVNIINVAAIFLIFTGIFFKLSIVPFHMWTPDVYEGSPLISITFFSTCQKISILALFINLLKAFEYNDDLRIDVILELITCFSLIIGSLGTLLQHSVKRLIAYSTILNLGYILLPLVGGQANGMKVEVSYFYIIIYAITIIGFVSLIISGFGRSVNELKIEHFSGLAHTNKALSLSITIIMFSLIGLPPFAGFFSKYFVLMNAMSTQNYTLVFTGLLAALIAAYCYLNIIKMMYFLDPVAKNIAMPLNYELMLVNGVSVFIIVVLIIIFIFINKSLVFLT